MHKILISFFILLLVTLSAHAETDVYRINTFEVPTGIDSAILICILKLG